MPLDPDSFLGRLRRRKLAQWTIAYLSGAWLTLQVISVISAQFAWPDGLVRGITIALGVGLLAVLTVAWFHGEKGHQRATRVELVLLTAIMIAGGLGIRAAAGGAKPRAVADSFSIDRDPAAIAIVPFGAAASDSLLDRLGRDLVITVGATLDGIETLRVIDPLTVLAHATGSDGVVSLERGVRLAGRLGAGRVLHGSLARAGDRVRLDATLYTVDGVRPVARVTVEEEPQQLSAITDSVVFALVRQLWSGPTPTIPSPAALATTSVEALRAYLDGEHALARAEMPRALASFERAYASDSTYWFAYWRSLYPRTYEGSRANPETLARVIEHRDALPPPDRLLVEAQLEPSERRRLALLERGSRTFPTHWPIWFAYANQLVHWAPYLGTDYDAARAALERVIELNPEFGPAWEHLYWIVAGQRDTVAIAATLARMETFHTSSASRFDDEGLDRYRTATRILLNSGRFPADELTRTAAFVVGHRGRIPPAAFGMGLLDAPHAQLQLGEAVLALEPGTELATAMWHGQALAHAGTGNWSAAAAAADEWSRMSGTPAAALGAYGLLAAGAALRMVPASDAAARRPSASGRFTNPPELAELAWLDGVVAYASADDAGLADAQRRVEASGSRSTPLLNGSLQALRLALAGRAEQAGRALLALEDDAADRVLQASYSRAHPYLSSINRILAAHWLLEAGEPAEAARLLTFVEAVLPGGPPLGAVNRTVGMLSLYDRARAEEIMGRLPQARTHYAHFLQQFDRPAPALEPLVDDARVRLDQLTREQRGRRRQ